MQVRRCSILYLEPREELAFSLEALCEGGDGLRRTRRWFALAPHLDHDIEVDAVERELLGQLGPDQWVAVASLAAHATTARIERLLQLGLLLSDSPEHARQRTRDDALRAAHWWPPAALMHRRSRWQGIDSAEAMLRNGTVTAHDLRSKLGPPPPAVHSRCSDGIANDSVSNDSMSSDSTSSDSMRITLARESSASAFDELLQRRTTCRNFDIARALPQALFARMLERVFAAHASVQFEADTVFLKRSSPSSGCLHSTGTYLLVQHVEDIAPGLYHYHPMAHALEPLPRSDIALDVLARAMLAGQHWFSNAHALVVHVARPARGFWKYRQHAKAYRALLLDVGHLSQTLYLAATDLQLGAFVTSAINEIDIEQALGLDALTESPLAISGFGWRAASMDTSEFDPLGKVWPRD